MNEVVKTLLSRRSIRKFKDKQVPLDVLKEILECGIYAPSGKNKQSSRIVVVQNPDLISKIAKINASFVNKENFDPFYGAPVLLIVFADKNIPTYIKDASAVIMNILNASFSLGVDSCWIDRAFETFSTKEGELLKQKWNLSDNFVGVGNVVLGYRDMDLPNALPRRDDLIIFDDEL